MGAREETHGAPDGACDVRWVGHLSLTWTRLYRIHGNRCLVARRDILRSVAAAFQADMSSLAIVIRVRIYVRPNTDSGAFLPWLLQPALLIAG